MNQEKIGKFIVKCRKEKNLTQEQLALKLGTTSKSISRWERGITMPDYSILEDLTKTLDISINEFFYGEKITKDELESTSEENLYCLYKNYRKTIKRKFIILSGMIGTLLGILFYFILR